MQYLAIISTSNPQLIQKKKFFWGSNYIQSINKFLPQEPISLQNLKKGYIYCLNSASIEKNNQNPFKPLSIDIKKITISNKFISLEFDFIKEVDIPSELIKKIGRSYLKKYNNISPSEATPFFFIVKKDEFEEMLESEKLKSLIEINFEKKNWAEISRLLEPHNDIENNSIWFDINGLTKAGFAFSRLAECSINLRKKFKSSKQINEFLSQIKKYRLMAEKILKRCIELDPSNPSHYSSLAYFYYQSATELTIPGGRRDGNFYELIENALFNLDAALNMDFRRLNDHYRRGYIFSNLLFKRLKFTKNKNSIPSKFTDNKILLSEGTQAFERVISIYETQIDEELKKRFYNIYLKSIYNLAEIYESNIIVKNEKLYQFIKKIFPDITLDNLENWKNFKSKNLLKALEYSEKIIRNINKKFISPEEENEITKLLSIEDSLNVEPVILTPLKGYQISKIYFKLFLVENNETYLNKAKQILLKTIQLRRTTKNDYFYIYNLLAQVYILDNKPSLALELLNNLKKNYRLPEYIKLTEAIAFIISGEFSNAEKNLLSICSIDLQERNPHLKNNEIYYPEVLFWIFIIKEKTNNPNFQIYKKMRILKNLESFEKFEEKNFNDNIIHKEVKTYLINEPENIYQELALKLIHLKLNQLEGNDNTK